MNKLLKTTAILASVLFLGACGERVSVNPGEVAKQMDSGELDEEIINPGRYRLDFNWIAADPRLIRLEVAKASETIEIASVFLPKSNVDLSDVTFGVQFRVKPSHYDKIFNDIRSEPDANGRHRIITTEMIYETYVKRKAPEAVIVALRQFTVEESMSQTEKIAEYALSRVNKSLEDTPVEVTELGFPNGVGTPPEEVLNAKRKLYAVGEEKERTIRKLQAKIEIEKHRQTLQKVRVKNDVENAETAKLDTSTYMFLKNMERFADAASDGTPVALGTNGSAFNVTK